MADIPIYISAVRLDTDPSRRDQSPAHVLNFNFSINRRRYALVTPRWNHFADGALLFLIHQPREFFVKRRNALYFRKKCFSATTIAWGMIVEHIRTHKYNWNWNNIMNTFHFSNYLDLLNFLFLLPFYQLIYIYFIIKVQQYSYVLSLRVINKGKNCLLQIFIKASFIYVVEDGI